MTLQYSRAGRIEMEGVMPQSCGTEGVMQQGCGIVTGIIKRNAEIADRVYEMAIEAEEIKSFVPGQFVNMYLNDKSMLLPRPISICDAENGTVTVVYRIAGKGTTHLASCRAGGRIRLSTPLGNGYNIEGDYAGKGAALVAGGLGAPPMSGLAKALKKRGAVVNVFLGFQSGTFLVEKFEEICENVFVATDDGSSGFHGNVAELLESGGIVYDVYFACGPKAMLKAVSGTAGKAGRDVQVSVEERMGCGYGACFGCTCRVKQGDGTARMRVCRDGPVFLGKDVVWDE